MTLWRCTWQSSLRPEHQDHDTQAKAEAHEADLRRKGVRAYVFAVVVQP